MQLADWRGVWRFDFRAEYDLGTKPDDAAMKANRYWWREQNRSLKRDCRETKDCWVPREHQGFVSLCQSRTSSRSNEHSVDTFTKAERSQIMRAVHSTGTTAENKCEALLRTL